jgi:cold shock CspA family protein
MSSPLLTPKPYRSANGNHQGERFGQQPIVDPKLGIELETTFIKTETGEWAISVSTSPIGLSGLAPGTTVMFAVGSGNDLGRKAKQTVTLASVHGATAMLDGVGL